MKTKECSGCEVDTNIEDLIETLQGNEICPFCAEVFESDLDLNNKYGVYHD